jgi:hypothetical protein
MAQFEVHTEPIGTLSSLNMESMRVEARVTSRILLNIRIIVVVVVKLSPTKIC